MLTQLERDLYSKKGIATLVVPTIAPAAIPHFSPYGDYSDDEDYYRYGGARPAPVVPVKKAMNFIDFYRFIFGFVKPEGQKSLEGAMAIALWGLVLTPKYALAKSFVEYVTVRSFGLFFPISCLDLSLIQLLCMIQTLGSGFKGVSADVWSQLLDFVSTVKEDLTGFSEDDACEWIVAVYFSSRVLNHNISHRAFHYRCVCRMEARATRCDRLNRINSPRFICLLCIPSSFDPHPLQHSKVSSLLSYLLFSLLTALFESLSLVSLRSFRFVCDVMFSSFCFVFFRLIRYFLCTSRYALM